MTVPSIDVGRSWARTGYMSLASRRSLSKRPTDMPPNTKLQSPSDLGWAVRLAGVPSKQVVACRLQPYPSL
ncbi:unnamed protein product [Taenia asiatica]|uniref:Uncharacterized protein n=1 Tax=Taenia asiatica TaxID=60517 RepID=A0A0R3VV44_TAEAS|nr:unnamed protein product [Taenia asiatica]